jgi:GTP-binding protein
MREAEGNVAIRVRDTENTDSYEVAGRGELQLGVLIETMRREGFELAVGRRGYCSRPIRRPASGSSRSRRSVVDVDDAYTGVVVEQIRSARASCRTCARPVPARPGWSSTPRRAA